VKAADKELWQYVDATLRRYAHRFCLRLTSVSHMSRRNRDYYDGSCSKRGKVRITIRRRNGSPLKAWEIVDAMAHELAHLPFQDHKGAWFKLYSVILHAMAHEGVFDKMRELCNK